MIRRAVAIASVVVACTHTDNAPVVRDIYVVRGAGLAPGALYATVTNTTAEPDTLVRIEVDGATGVDLHKNVRDASGSVTMQPVSRLIVPSNATTRLRPGGTHGMVSGLRANVARGDSLAATFHLARRGPVRAYARVIDYDQVDKLIVPGGR